MLVIYSDSRTGSQESRDIPGEGNVTISPDGYAVAGESGTWTLTYTCGSEPLRDGSVLRVDVPAGWTPPQMDDEEGAGYTVVDSSNSSVSFSMSFLRNYSSAEGCCFPAWTNWDLKPDQCLTPYPEELQTNVEIFSRHGNSERGSMLEIEDPVNCDETDSRTVRNAMREIWGTTKFKHKPGITANGYFEVDFDYNAETRILANTIGFANKTPPNPLIASWDGTRYELLFDSEPDPSEEFKLIHWEHWPVQGGYNAEYGWTSPLWLTYTP